MDILCKSSILVLVIALCECQEIAFFRCNNITKSLQFVYANDGAAPVYDLFAQDKSSTCSLRAGAFTGSGVVADPYILDVDLSNGLSGQSPDCGVTQAADGTVQLEMLVQSACGGVTAADSSFTSTCRMVIPDSSTGGVSGQASYSCIAPSTILFDFYLPAPETVAPADVYGTGKRLTCSKTAGSGSGQGLEADPFQLRIDVNNVLNDCGVQNVDGDVYSVVMYVQQLETVLTSADLSFQLTCNFTATVSQTIQTVVLPAVNLPPTEPVTPTISSATLSVVTGSGTSTPTSLVVGQQIRLLAQLLDGPATGLRITSCEARPGPDQDPAIQVLDSQGCPTGSALIPSFVGQTPTGTVSITALFDAFKFDSSDTVYFQCQATFCYDNSLACLGSQCDQNNRRKRDTDQNKNDKILGVSIVVREFVNTTESSETSPNSPRSTTDHRNSTDSTVGNTEINKRRTSRWPVTAIITATCQGAIIVVCFLALAVQTSKLRRSVKDCEQSK